MSPVDSVFSFDADVLSRPLLAVVAIAMIGLVAHGVRAPHLARIGLRNVPRRWLRTCLIVFGLMLATSFVASSLAIDDTITQAVRAVAVFNLGRVDEDVTGGLGALGVYPRDVGSDVAARLSKDPLVAGVAPALVAPNTLVADTTSREARGAVSAIAMDGSQGGPLSALSVVNPAGAPPALGLDGVFLNQSLATTLNARVGDAVTLYSIHWTGQRYTFRVRAIVSGGPLGDLPSIVLTLPALQRVTMVGDNINHTFIANAGNGVSGVGFSDSVANDARAVIPGFVHVTEVKRNGVDFALRAQDLFGRILTLYTLFALAIGLLLIFLIFTLLAAERRAELGVARAIGMRRSHLIWTLLFEGGGYDVIAAAAGVVSGLGLGAVVLAVASPTLRRIGFPVTFVFNPASAVVAFAVGLLFTLITIAAAAWTISRMTIVAAIRDLPEPPAAAPSVAALVRKLLSPGLSARAHSVAAAELGWRTVTLGLVPLAFGYWALELGVARADALLFAAGLSVVVAGMALLIRAFGLAVASAFARRGMARAPLRMARSIAVADRGAEFVIGGALALYWSLPFDALVGVFGLPRFNGGIQIFFVAGVMMVLGSVLALAPNLDVLIAPLRLIGARLGRIGRIVRIALVYPSQQRFRTGIGLALFALSIFTMVVMDTIAASTTRAYDNLPAQAANYDIVGQPLFAPAGGAGAVRGAVMRASPQAASAIVGVGEATPLSLGLIEPGAPSAAWRFYPASIIQGSLLDGTGFSLAARAVGFSSDAAVWQAVRTTPGDVVIDSSALAPEDARALGLTPAPPPGAAQFLGPPIAAGLPGVSPFESLQSQRAATTAVAAGGEGGLSPLTVLDALLNNQDSLHDYTLRLSGLAQGAGRIAPTTVWAADVRGGAATRLTVIGIVENSRGSSYGLMGSPQTLAPVEQGLPAIGSEFYYFKLAPGANARVTAYAIGSALIDDGFEATTLQDTLLDATGARVFISRALVGLVGLTLLVGMAALAVTGSRAVVERRQQIGMLRALGFHRGHVRLIFLVETLTVGTVGALLGAAFGLILCRNIFAVDFFERYQSGLVLITPWKDISMIIGAALLASMAAAIAPTWQAGRVTPADALRYE